MERKERTKIEEKFVKDWGEELAQKVWECAYSHANGINDANKGSDPFKWALLIVIGYQCFEIEDYRKYHGVPDLDWEKMKKWIRDNAELETHDGDCDYLSLWAGRYNYYVGLDEERR